MVASYMSVQEFIAFKNLSSGASLREPVELRSVNHFTGGYAKPHQQSLTPKMEPLSSINGVATNNPRSTSSRSSGASSAPAEVPLDLTKSNQTDDQQSNRKRSRKGKAFKLDALCLRLQEKMNSENGELEGVSSTLPSNHSSPHMSDQERDTCELPRESTEKTSPEICHDRTTSIDYTTNQESNNNSINLDGYEY